MAPNQSGTAYGKIRAPLDQKVVDDYLSKHVDGFKAPSQIKQFSFGQSNPTYFITDANGKRYVLRKKPSGGLVSKTAHAVEREYRVIECVGKTGKVPVPIVYCLCTDESVLGTPFYVMEYLEGRIFTDVRMPEIATKAEREKCWLSIISVLAELHKLDPQQIGLGDYGSTKPFYPRQIKSLSKVSEAQAAVKDKEGEAVGDIPSLEYLLEWYSKHTPQGGKWEGRLVHGDFKCDNMIFHPTEPRVIGILDWELSTLGEPLSDLANLLQPFYIPPAPGQSPSMMVALRGMSKDELPIPDADTLLASYSKTVGRQIQKTEWTAAVSFAFFRLAVIAQGIAARFARGQASSEQAHLYATMFPLIGSLALDTIERSGQSKL